MWGQGSALMDRQGPGLKPRQGPCHSGRWQDQGRQALRFLHKLPPQLALLDKAAFSSSIRGLFVFLL